MVGHALATYLAEQRPCFVLTETSLTNWEATIDRGVETELQARMREFQANEQVPDDESN